VRAKAAEDLETVDAGEHHIEYHQIDAGLPRPFQAAVAFVLAIHRETFASEEFTEQSAQLRVVVDQQEVHG
jgi:hypothetical protein